MFAQKLKFLFSKSLIQNQIILCAFNRTEVLVLENLSGLGRLNLPLGATEPALASGALCSKPIEPTTDGRFNRVLFLDLSGGNRLNWPTMRGGSTRVGQLSWSVEPGLALVKTGSTSYGMRLNHILRRKFKHLALLKKLLYISSPLSLSPSFSSVAQRIHSQPNFKKEL